MTRFEARFDLQGWYLVRQVVRLRKTLGRWPPRLIDLGMGRGRDLIWYARCGFQGFGVDLDRTGIERANRRASRLGVAIRARRADLRLFRPRARVEVVYSNCALNVLPRRIRSSRFRVFQEVTNPGGINAVNAFVARRSLRPAPDLDPGSTLYRPGELRQYYRGWEVLDSKVEEFLCDATGTRHRHALEYLVARKPPTSAPLPKRAPRLRAAARGLAP